MTQNGPSLSGATQASEPAVVPRDVRLLHLIFATQGVQNYQDHVPLQLMDFAHRYTSAVLKDAVTYGDHARGSNGSSQATAAVNTDDIRLAIAAKTNYQFKPAPAKELMLELAHERNGKSLPPVIPKWGLNLPPEKYCLTAKDWDSLDEERGDLDASKRRKH
ncbi:transcription factor TAFII-31 [Metschnikowia bicuspidata var. bicuspidata NRRL YB-4993]|uniref:Transcription factor TAFII-31 n=1 Tax=Metschnikowia bicuspidata var. bicuspidata NRRL YB-4993 TaxID=869754 RepID=A0A1A0HC13_9ASCO|nr:transcription factor TAFII-31 [Metschnikowia bicuspidata var. bicuspidata NRRL YB-4993]OBA21674.1 transcription factor TAFII-31 [Metschnikowia bicuspidata var. bicuspidata NRRL YB-4993]